MPFGDYDKESCKNPECRKMFKPVTPWQVCCCKACNNHCVYLRTVLKKRLKMAEARFEKWKKEMLLRKDAGPEMAGRIARIQERLDRRRKDFKVRMSGVK